MWRSEGSLRRLLNPLFTTWDADWAGYTGDAVRDMPFDFRIPTLATDAELDRLTMPVLCSGRLTISRSRARQSCVGVPRLARRTAHDLPGPTGGRRTFHIAAGTVTRSGRKLWIWR